MADVFSQEKRHEIMRKIKCKDTEIEVKSRHWLFNHGIRYRKHLADVIGKPDIVIKKYKIAIFVNGCFWHGHENCKNYRLPKVNVEFWENKIHNNKKHDKEVCDKLKKLGWSVFHVWECSIKSDFEHTMVILLSEIHKVQEKYQSSTLIKESMNKEQLQ